MPAPPPRTRTARWPAELDPGDEPAKLSEEDRAAIGRFLEVEHAALHRAGFATVEQVTTASQEVLALAVGETQAQNLRAHVSLHM